MAIIDIILEGLTGLGKGLENAARIKEAQREYEYREEMRKVATLKAYGIDPMEYKQAAYWAKQLKKGAVTWSYSCRCGFSETVRGNKKRNDNCPKCGKRINWHCNPD